MRLHAQSLRSICRYAAITLSCLQLAATSATSATAQTQDRPGKRVANIVVAAVDEYAKGVDSTGALTSRDEYEEAVTFMIDARAAAARLSGDRADSARLGLDSMVARMQRQVPPKDLQPLVKQIMSALGAEAALDLPSRPIDLLAGRQLFGAHCASCHGPRGMGDGPAARGMSPAPPALGTAAVMRDRTPGLVYRILSVGVAGTPMAAWSGILSANDRWNIIAYLNTLRAPGSLAEGQGLYVQKCAACHGAAGASNGTLTSALSRLPAELSSFAWQAEKSDAQLVEMIRTGVPGTAMPASRELSATDVDRIVAYVRTLALTDFQATTAPTVATDADATRRAVLSLLDESLAAARAGRHDEATDRAFDAYIAFEPLETPARARDPGLVSSLERHFANFKGAIKGNDLRTAEGARNAVEEGLPALMLLTQHTVGAWEAFLQSLLIILREGFEAILVIGAIVALLIKTGHRERLRSIWFGVLSALGASGLTAIVLATLLSAIPASREIIEGITMLVAVAVLFSVSYWLISKVEAAKWQQFIREKVTAALEHGGGKALAFVAFLAVYREGAETALFYQALFQEGRGNGIPIALGLLAGVAGLVVIFTLFYRYGVKIRLRPFFAVTSALLYYLAFVFMGKGIAELQEGNIVPITVLPGWPHVEAMGIFPTVETLLAQAVLVGLFVFAILKTFWPRRAVTLPTMPADAAQSAADVRLASIMERLDRVERRLEEADHEPEANPSRVED